MTRPELCARLPARARKLSRETRRRINQEAHRLAQEFERTTRDRLVAQALQAADQPLPPTDRTSTSDD